MENSITITKKELIETLVADELLWDRLLNDLGDWLMDDSPDLIAEKLTEPLKEIMFKKVTSDDSAIIKFIIRNISDSIAEDEDYLDEIKDKAITILAERMVDKQLGEK